jgi:F-type H+-transporting ATPase subunit alpha
MAASLFAVNKGYMDDIESSRCCLRGGLHHLKTATPRCCSAGGDKALDKDKEAEAELTAAIEAFKKSFA